jgi:DNA replication protein DnaC
LADKPGDGSCQQTAIKIVQCLVCEKEGFDFHQARQIPAAKIRELAEGGYIDRAEPVVFMGECGTGKIHLATSLCVAACRQKRRVRFTTAVNLASPIAEHIQC